MRSGFFHRLRFAFLRWKTGGDIGQHFVEQQARRLDERRRPMTAWRRFWLARYYRKHPEKYYEMRLRESDRKVQAMLARRR